MNNSTIAANSTSDDGDFGGEEFADCPYSQPSNVEMGIKSSMMLAILVFSLIGNILVIKVIRRNVRFRKVTHYLIVNLAVADLLITVIRMPEATKNEITGTYQWFSGSFALILCKLLSFCQIVSISCSIFTMVAISIHKYVGIVYPFRRILTLERLRVGIALVWLASAITASPQLIANNLVHDPDGSTWCVEEWPSPFDPELAPKHYTIVYLVALYLFPLCAITALYIRMLVEIRKRRVPGNRSESVTCSQRSSRQKAGKMIAVVIICFALCWLPYHVSFFLFYFEPSYAACGPPDVVWFLGGLFGYANSALNPCIYFLMNRNYRSELKEILRCRRRAGIFPRRRNEVGLSPSRTETAAPAAPPEGLDFAQPPTVPKKYEVISH